MSKVVFFFLAIGPSVENDNSEDDILPTAVELSLPWKRNTGREPMSSVETHSMPDDSCPVRSEVPLWVSGFSENTVSLSRQPHSVLGSGVEAATTETDEPAAGDLGCDVQATGVDGTVMQDLRDGSGGSPRTHKLSCRSVGDAMAEISGLADFSSDTIPPPWRTASKINSESQLNRPFIQDWSDCVDRPSYCQGQKANKCSNRLEAEVQQNCDTVSPLPWRDFSGNDRVVPDQHAPRPSLTSSFGTEHVGSELNCGSPSQSCFDGISMHPQASCQSFRLSEAESRHSEPFRLHHVIDMTPVPAAHWLPSSFAPESDDTSSEILLNLEHDNNKDRIFQWLEALEDSSVPDFDAADKLNESE